jgi:hypothetical protein
MEPAGRANARTVGAIRGARIGGGCVHSQRATEGIGKTHVFAAQVLVRCVLMLALKEEEEEKRGYFLTLLASILMAGSSSLVVKAVSTANGFSMPR